MKRGFTKQDFYDKLQPNGDCLEWNGGRTTDGYGCTKVNGIVLRTHRLALELEGIDISGHLVLHSCDNPACCNPDHLRTGTSQDNVDDMVSRGRHSGKLTEQQVLEIRAITGMSQQAIADQYGVSQSVISSIIRRKSWTHV